MHLKSLTNKIVTGGTMPKSKVVCDFAYKDRNCLVVHVDNSDVREQLKGTVYMYNAYSDYHDAYIEVKTFDDVLSILNDRYPERMEFYGKTEHDTENPDRYYAKFSTNSQYHTNDTRTEDYVYKQTQRIVLMMNER